MHCLPASSTKVWEIPTFWVVSTASKLIYNGVWISKVMSILSNAVSLQTFKITAFISFLSTQRSTTGQYNSQCKFLFVFVCFFFYRQNEWSHLYLSVIINCFKSKLHEMDLNIKLENWFFFIWKLTYTSWVFLLVRFRSMHSKRNSTLSFIVRYCWIHVFYEY